MISRKYFQYGGTIDPPIKGTGPNFFQSMDMSGIQNPYAPMLPRRNLQVMNIPILQSRSLGRVGMKNQPMYNANQTQGTTNPTGEITGNSFFQGDQSGIEAPNQPYQPKRNLSTVSIPRLESTGIGSTFAVMPEYPSITDNDFSPAEINPNVIEGRENIKPELFEFEDKKMNIEKVPSPYESGTPSTATASNPYGVPYNDYRFPMLQANLGIDALALARNLAQGPPPSVQMGRTNLPRLREDYTIIDEQQRQLEAGMTTGREMMNRRLGSASDLMNANISANAQLMDAQAQLDAQERAMSSRETQINQQIAAQEQKLQTQEDNQNTQLNYQIQQQAQQQKDAMVSQQLSNVKQDLLNIEQANIDQTYKDMQYEMDQEFKDLQTKIQLGAIDIMQAQEYQANPVYQQGLLESKMQHQKDIISQGLATLAENENFDNTITGLDYEDIANTEMAYNKYNQDYTNAQNNIARLNDELANAQQYVTQAQTEEDRLHAQAMVDDLNNQLSVATSNAESIGNEFNKLKKRYDSYLELNRYVNSNYDLNNITSSYDENYRTERGIRTQSEILNELRNELGME